MDACTCSQKGVGAPSGLAPIALDRVRSSTAGTVPQFLSRPGAARGLLGPPQIPPHDSAPLVYALHEALVAVERKGSRRDGRGTRGTIWRSRGLGAMGLNCCRRPPNVSGRSTRCVCRPAWTKPPCGRAADGQDRDRRWARAAGRKNLEGRPDGRQLDTAAPGAVPGRAGSRDAPPRPPLPAGRRRRGGAGPRRCLGARSPNRRGSFLLATRNSPSSSSGRQGRQTVVATDSDI